MTPRRAVSPILARLAALHDPAALCRALAEALLVKGEPCAHTYRQTYGYFARHAPEVDVDTYITLLQALGGECDCRIGYNVCACHVPGA